MKLRVIALLVFAAMPGHLSAVAPLAVPQDGEPIARVEVISFDATGKRIPESRIEVFVNTAGKNYASEFKDGIATGIPFDTYRARIYSSGSQSVERTVKVSQSSIAVYVGLQLGEIADYAAPPPPSRLSGHVTNGLDTRDEIFFVKLMALFSDYSADSEITSDGQFQFTNVPTGPAVLLVVSHDRIRAFRLVELPSFHERLQIDVEILDDPPLRWY